MRTTFIVRSALLVAMTTFTLGMTSCGGDNDKKSGKDDDLSSIIPDSKDIESAVNDLFEEAKPLVDSVAKGFGGDISDEDYEESKDIVKETVGKVGKEMADSAKGQINIIKEEASKKVEEVKEQLGLSDSDEKSTESEAEQDGSVKEAQKTKTSEDSKPEARAQEPEKPSTDRTTVAKVPPAPKPSVTPELESKPVPKQRALPKPLPEQQQSADPQAENLEGDVVLEDPEQSPATSQCRCPRKNGADESVCNCSETQNGCTCGTGYCEGCDCKETMTGKNEADASDGPSTLAIIGIVLLVLLLVAVIALIFVIAKKRNAPSPNTPPYNPNNGYNQPYNNGYNQPNNGYQYPDGGYQQPDNGYSHPDDYNGDTRNQYWIPDDKLEGQQPNDVNNQ